jgi:hypothetical protein
MTQWKTFSSCGRDASLGRRLMFAIRSYRNGDRVDGKKLRGQTDSWRIRVGDWRVVLLVQGREASVEAIDNRRDAY